MKHDVCGAGALGEGGPIEVEVGGVKILLSRQPNGIAAVGALCPHKGAPLKDGTIVDGKIICPWHHAIFDLATGDHLEPPGRKCLTRFEAAIENGRIVVEVGEGASEHRPEVAPADRRSGGADVFVIVGAGAAGFACAEELVKQGFDGRVVMISPEAEPPYDRTDLSKTYLAGKMSDEKLSMTSPATLDDLGIETKVGEVERVDPAACEVRLMNGERLAFTKCFVAPGSAAAKLDLPNADLPNVHHLRSHADASRLKAATDKARHVIVLGAGFIGMEAAAQLASSGKRVSVIAKDKLPFIEQFGSAVAGQIAAQHEAKGVALHTEAEVDGFEAAHDEVTGVRLKSGEFIEGDLVLVAIGAAPRTMIVDPEARRGIEVDAMLRISPNVHLGGDIAAVPVPGSAKPLRIEHWRVAEQHGRQAARAMLGKAGPFAGIPFFWTAQFDRVSYLGHADSADMVHVEGDLEAGSYTAFIIERGTVTAAVGRGGGDRTPDLHALMLRDRTPAAEALERVGWDPAKLL